jgi:hypothetical protein
MKPKNRSRVPDRASRRSFTKTVAATLVASPLASTLAQNKPSAPKEPPAPPNPQPSPTPQQKPSPVADAYFEVLRARFGEHIAPEQFEQIKKELQGNVRAADGLRAVKLRNEDEPDFIFSAD